MFFGVLALIGGVVGSGFITGKEIVIFFARNGVWGFLGVGICTIGFFILVRYFLINGERIHSLIASSKIFLSISIALNVILSSSMLGGISSLIGNKLLFLPVLIFTLLLCLLVFVRGGGVINKLNLILVPSMITSFLFILCGKVDISLPHVSGKILPSVWFSILYLVLNVSNNALLISSLGNNLSKKQKTGIAFFSSLALCFLLLLTVTVLLQNQGIIGCDMPFIQLAKGGQRIIMRLLVFLGSLTSLFSLVYSSSSHLRGLNINEMINFSLCCLLPTLLSFLGFNFLVTYLYPLASVLGLLQLVMVIFAPSFFHSFFKNANKKIHSARKDTKKNNTRHDNIKF